MNKSSPKYLEGRNLLSKDLWPVYQRLVDEYAYFALLRTGRAWVAYKVMANLVLSGWRPSGEDRNLTSAQTSDS